MRVWLLLGRRDMPTDGVEDYCERLAGALERRGHNAAVVRVPWIERGWLASLKGMCMDLATDQVEWVIMQFTHLMWSRRGFPIRALAAAAATRLSGKKLCVLIHDPSGFPGRRPRDRARRLVQHAVMRALMSVAHQGVVTVAHKGVPWVGVEGKHIPMAIPVGSNILPTVSSRDKHCEGCLFTISVFGVTEGSQCEAREIAEVARRVAAELGAVRLLLFGRGVEVAAPWVKEMVGRKVFVDANGLMRSDKISDLLRRSDALLFVRGVVSSRRGTVVAAIAHGLPVVGYQGEETGHPGTEAGVALVRQDDTAGLVRELVRIASEPGWAKELQRRSVDAYEQYFSWDRIAALFEQALSCPR
jgi:hypothetical protein